MSSELALAGATGHAVQFYEREEHLASFVGEFLAVGLAGGDRGVVIATDEHRAAIEADLIRRGAPLQAVLFADARGTLAAFMLGKLPDAVAFRAAIGDLLDRAMPPNAGLRAYGEMVDLLWRDGNPEGALRLEELWNDLIRERGIELLCGYSMGNFYNESQSARFEAVCRSHATVAPAESFPRHDDAERMAGAIAILQQRAGALEAEIAYRKRHEDEQRFLLDVTAALNRSLEYEARLREVAELAVPRLADACTVDLMADGETAARSAAARAGDAGLPSRARDAMLVPLAIGDRVLGTLALYAADRSYDERDLALATEFARRGAIALENAHLYEVARQANHAKDEFLATLSHELRTPLTAILGWSRMLSLGALDPETTQTAVETIEASARTQATLIDAMLDVSRIVTGKMTLQSELVDLGSVVASAVQTVKLAADARKIHIDIRGTATRTIVAGDPTRLQQIVWNLLSNAIKFSSAGGHVEVAVEREADRARIVVRDDGHGIAPEFLPHVFEPFRQAEDSEKRMHNGLGLGLAIVKYLTELHGGSVVGSSKGEGKGATFVVTLPLATRSRIA